MSTVKIGNQEWMAENLDVSVFRNGDTIFEAKTSEEWKRAGIECLPAWCYYNNDSENGKKYGKLYNWYAVNDPRGLAPEGWHIPSDNEWTQLVQYLGGVKEAGIKMKSIYDWLDDDNGTNESGFSGLPGGFRYYYGCFFSVGSNGFWWSSSEENTFNAWYSFLYQNYGSVYRFSFSKQNGLSVRCLRD